MLTDTRFYIGVAVGLAAAWAFHSFIMPLPGGKTSSGG